MKPYLFASFMWLLGILSSKTKKCFIAGATCPKCNTLDTVALTLENAIETLICVQYGYSQP